jgi:hypothetical protein
MYSLEWVMYYAFPFHYDVWLGIGHVLYFPLSAARIYGMRLSCYFLSLPRLAGTPGGAPAFPFQGTTFSPWVGISFNVRELFAN